MIIEIVTYYPLEYSPTVRADPVDEQFRKQRWKNCRLDHSSRCVIKGVSV